MPPTSCRFKSSVSRVESLELARFFLFFSVCFFTLTWVVVFSLRVCCFRKIVSLFFVCRFCDSFKDQVFQFVILYVFLCFTFAPSRFDMSKFIIVLRSPTPLSGGVVRLHFSSSCGVVLLSSPLLGAAWPPPSLGDAAFSSLPSGGAADLLSFFGTVLLLSPFWWCCLSSLPLCVVLRSSASFGWCHRSPLILGGDSFPILLWGGAVSSSVLLDLLLLLLWVVLFVDASPLRVVVLSLPSFFEVVLLLSLFRVGVVLSFLLLLLVVVLGPFRLLCGDAFLCLICVVLPFPFLFLFL